MKKYEDLTNTLIDRCAYSLSAIITRDVEDLEGGIEAYLTAVMMPFYVSLKKTGFDDQAIAKIVSIQLSIIFTHLVGVSSNVE